MQVSMYKSLMRLKINLLEFFISSRHLPPLNIVAKNHQHLLKLFSYRRKPSV